MLIGGADNIDQPALARLRPFVAAVLEAAREARAAVIDGGTDSGVMALAGEARAQMQATDDVRPAPTLMGIAPRGRVAAPGVVGAGGDTPLEGRHSHHLLVPGDEWGTETSWVLEVSARLSAGEPVVAVLIDGGPLALREAAACAARGWPVIALSGSGRSADQLAEHARKGRRELAVDRRQLRVVELDSGPRRLTDTLRGMLVGEDPRAVPEAELYPALYLTVAETSRRGQRNLKRLAAIDIGSSLAAASIALLATLPPGERLLAQLAGNSGRPTAIDIVVAAAAIPFLIAVVVKLISMASGFVADWYRGRAVAETVKGMAWRYMMRADPYDGDDGDERFRGNLTRVLRQADVRQTLDRLPDRPVQVTHQMRAVRGAGTAVRRDIYVARRVRAQVDWYRDRSRANRRLADLWFWGSLGLQLTAAGSAVVALIVPNLGDQTLKVVALLATVALAGTAWAEINRFAELARSYALTLHELLIAAETVESAQTESGLQSAVGAVEAAIAREHSMWIVRGGQPVALPEPAGAERD